MAEENGKRAYKLNNCGMEQTVYFTTEEINHIFLPLLTHLTNLEKEKGRRLLVLLAAPPGAGKTTLLQFLKELSERSSVLTPVTVIGMDGFHRYRKDLENHFVCRGGQEIPMTKIKGAPETFDLARLTERVQRIAAGENCGYPAYDRRIHDPVENAVTVCGNIVLLEGNYLLLNREGWKDLQNYADYTISITADEELLRERLIDRKVGTGVSRAEAEKFVDYSDLYNVRMVLRDTMKADLCLRVSRDGFSVAERSAADSSGRINQTGVERHELVERNPT